MHGLLVIDKPAGPTSHDVVARMRRVLGERRIGHTGTLDPAATGVLPLVLGRATRLARFLSTGDKVYEAAIRLGFATDTYDAAGSAVGAVHRGPWPTRAEIAAALDAFRGEFLQEPPAFSAKKIAGRRSYRIARAASAAGSDTGLTPTEQQGSDPGQTPRPVAVMVYALDLVDAAGDCVSLRIRCSAGFYVRSLAHDLGRRLGTGAHLAALRRTHSGELAHTDALPLDVAEDDPGAARAAIVPLERMLPGLAAVVLTDAGARRATQGQDLAAADVVAGAIAGGPVVRLLDGAGRLLGIAEPAGRAGLLHPFVVLV
jgi:tRNA pseudouridine55 synthase